jgi:hypothetical protein
MTKESKAMKEIHEIRLKEYEDTKNMTTEQRMDRIRKSVDGFEAKYGKLRRVGEGEELQAV